MQASEVRRLRSAPDFRLNLAVGDSLLHGRRFRDFEDNTGPQRTFDTEEVFRDELAHHYEVEDAEALHRILGRQYHAVVGNPPYITVKDRALSELYRARYPSCRGKYSLSVPFMERFFDLAVKGDGTSRQPAGCVGQITTNSFMKREFGKKLIEEYLPRWDLTHVLDTSGAYIPGHGTPTVILFGKNQPPVNSTIRTVLGIHGEPATPVDPAQGLVWQAIVRQMDEPGSVSEWMSAADSPRENFHRHPWSIGGGGAAELKELIEEAGDVVVAKRAVELGISAVTGEDDLFVAPQRADLLRHRVEKTRAIVTGDLAREWKSDMLPESVWLYDDKFGLLKLESLLNTARFLWPYRANISRRRRFGIPMLERGLMWYEWQELYIAKLETSLTITWGEVATHNHFVLDRGGKVFKNTAPVLKLRPDATEADHIHLLGVLNSSTACFYLKQICHNKGSTVDEHGARQRTTPFEDFYAFNGTKLAAFPIPARQPKQFPTLIVQTSEAQQGQTPSATLAAWGGPGSGDLRMCLTRARDEWHTMRRRMIAWQEELDWQVYEAFGLVASAKATADRVSLEEGTAGSAIPCNGIELGQRAFEIVLARRMAAGEVQTTWFERHGSTPITEIPADWPAEYRTRVERRIARIGSDPNIRLIEQPEYKRRWNTEPWDDQLVKALRQWLLLRLEGCFFEAGRMQEPQPSDMAALRRGWPAGQAPVLASTHRLADCVRADPAFLQVAELYRGRPDFDLAALVAELVEEESVPFLPVQRYKESGLRNRRIWEEVWNLQRLEDHLDALMEAARKERETLAKAMMDAPASSEVPTWETRVRELNASLEAWEAEKAVKVGTIPVPPKYASKDFKSGSYWKHRGKLDVPKERWISYPGAERGADTSLVIAWAGWDHLQQAKALTAHLEDLKSEGASDAQQLLLLAGLDQLIPWLLQWHNDPDPEFGERLGDYFKGYLADELRRLGKTREDLDRVAYGE